MPTIVQIDDLPTPRIERMALADFLALKPFPGHRDSVNRAAKSKHLHVFLSVHAEVQLAEYREPSGAVCLVRLTGNTRAEAWAAGLSDKVPSHVIASIYPVDDAQQARDYGMLFDSAVAAWKPTDFAFRATGMAFGDQWRPRSATCKSTRLSRVVRLAQGFEDGHYDAETSHTIEQAMPKWAKEIKLLDVACEAPLAVPGGNFSSGVQTACLLQYRYETTVLVDAFIRMSRADEGTKNGDGMDGVQLCVEVIKSRGHGKKQRSTKSLDLEDAKRVLTAFDQFKSGDRSLRPPHRIDPVLYAIGKREQQRAA